MTFADRYSFVLAALLLVAACQPESTEPDAVQQSAVVERDAVNALSLDTAEQRKARIKGLQYELFVDIASNPDQFTGEAVLRFDLVDDSRPLTIDFTGGAVDALTIDGAAVDAAYNGYFITVPADALVAGPTEIRISYTHAFSDDGTGSPTLKTDCPTCTPTCGPTTPTSCCRHLINRT